MTGPSPMRARLRLGLELALYGAAIFLADWLLTAAPNP